MKKSGRGTRRGLREGDEIMATKKNDWNGSGG